MNSLRVAAIVIAMAILVACAVTGDNLLTKTTSADSSSIVGQWQRSGLSPVWHGYRLDSVDGEKVSYGLTLNPYIVPIEIDPGSREIVVYTIFNTGTTQLSANIPMTVDIKPSTKYVINALVSGKYIEAWIEHATTGEKASATSRGDCKKSVAVGFGFIVGPCTD